MKILVTGIAGFIGFHVAKKLLERGDEVVGLDNINNYYDVNLKFARLEELGIEKEKIFDNTLAQSSIYSKHKFLKLDISNREQMREFFEREYFDAVCHLAAQDGLNKSQPFKTSDHTDHSISLYASRKKANEMMAHAYAHLYGMKVTGLRFFTVYGPWGRPDMAPMLFANAISTDKTIKIFNNGDMQRDFTYIDDIVDGVIKVIDNPAEKSEVWDVFHPDPNESTASYKIYNIGNSSPIKLMDFTTTLETKLGKVAKKGMLSMQYGDVQSTYADISGLINYFDYKPSTSPEQGIEKFINWYKEYYAK